MSGLEPIRVFVDAHLFDQEQQGSRTCILEIYKRLAEKKDLQLYLAAFNTRNLRNNFNGNDNIIYLTYPGRSKWSRLLFDIPALLRQYRIDLAHFQYITPLQKPCKYLVTIHDMLFAEHPTEFSSSYRYSRRLLFAHGAQKADQVITVSDHSYVSLQRWLNLKDKKVSVIRNGVDERYFRPYDKVACRKKIHDKFRLRSFILYVSRFEPRKNHTGALNAWLDLELYKENIDLVFLGHKSMGVPSFEKRLNELDPAIRRQVVLLDDISNEDLLDLYRSAILFIYPSIAEGFGIPPLEAGATRTPVICSDLSAMKEYDFFGEGHLDPRNQERLTGIIRQYIDRPPDDTLLDKISNTIKQRYSWEQAAEGHYQLIRELANKE